MSYKLSKDILEIFEKFEEAGYKIYLVGGSVRDLLMGRKTHDWDFTTDAKPEEILKLFPKGFYNNKFGTVGIPLKTTKNHRSESSSRGIGVSEIIEITTMRKEGNYKDFRHPVKVSWTDKIEEDLGRRDFTINALALDKTGSIIDPFNGQLDLQNGILKAVGNPDKRFREDALRLIRAIRISGELEFEIEPKTLNAIRINNDLIKEIAPERIRDELFKILSSVNPYMGIKMLKGTGLLKIILPEVEDCFGIIQEGPKHDRTYDIGEHLLLTMKFTPTNNPLVRFSALLHDIGKSQTYKKDSLGNVTFYNHEILGAQMAKKIAQRFNLSKVQTEKLFKLVRYHMFSINENQTDSAIRRFVRNIGIENIEDMFALRVGDRLGGGTKTAVSWRMKKYRERIGQVMQKPFSITDLKVNGKDVMQILKIQPGRRVGEVLQELFEEVLKDSTKNNHDYLIKRIQEV